jgi:hypothetical protein
LAILENGGTNGRWDLVKGSKVIRGHALEGDYVVLHNDVNS